MKKVIEQIKFWVGHKKGKVVIDFGRPIRQLVLGKKQARELLETLEWQVDAAKAWRKVRRVK